MFEDFKKEALEAQKRWDKILLLSEELKNINASDPYIKSVVEIVLLLVEQFKPINKDETESFVKEIFDAFTGGKIHDK